MWLLRERLSDYQSKRQWAKSYIKLTALCVHPKNSNHLRSHLRAITALDHSRLSLKNKFLENKSGRIFWVRQVYFTNSCQQIWGWVNQPLYFLYITSEVKQYYLSYRPRTECGISQFFEAKLYSVNVQDDQSWAFSETVQKSSKISHTASRFSFLVRAVSVVECLNEL